MEDNEQIKITLTNVISLRSVWKRGYVEWINEHNPDIILLQETKMYDGAKPPLNAFFIPGYEGYFLDCTAGKGMHGTGVYTKIKPISVVQSLPDYDNQGICITLEFKKFYLVNSYVPNAGRNLEKLDWKINEWNPTMNAYLNQLREKKPVIWAGDLNVIHQNIDIYKPEGHERMAGFTIEERNWFTSFLNQGYLDLLRYLYPNKQVFTFYTQYGGGNAKKYNRGLRLDYFVMHKDDLAKFEDGTIKDIVLEDSDFSDHVPSTMIVDKSLFEEDERVSEPIIVRLNDNKVFSFDEAVPFEVEPKHNPKKTNPGNDKNTNEESNGI